MDPWRPNSQLPAHIMGMAPTVAGDCSGDTLLNNPEFFAILEGFSGMGWWEVTVSTHTVHTSQTQIFYTQDAALI